MTIAISPDLSSAKGQPNGWSTWDVAEIGAIITIVGETIREAAGVRAGQQRADGTSSAGSGALATARRRRNVPRGDSGPALHERAAGGRVPDDVLESFDGALALPDGAFDVVFSTLGVMLTPQQEQAARELQQVCRQGETVAMITLIRRDTRPIGEPGAQPQGRRAAGELGRVRLSPRELEVLQQVAAGRTSREIGELLFISPRTVEMHVQNMLGKLECRSRAQATRKAAELGLLERTSEGEGIGPRA